MKLKIAALLVFLLTSCFICSLTSVVSISYANEDYYLVSSDEDNPAESGDEEPYYDEDDQGSENSMDEYMPEEGDDDGIDQPEEDMENDETTI